MLRLTQTYSSVFDYKIELATNLEGRARSAVSHNSLVIRGKSSGFFILQQKMGTAGTGYIFLSVDARQLKRFDKESDLFYVQGGDLKNSIQEALGNDFQLEAITSDTLYFQFPEQSHKKVPVSVKKNITFKPQYTAVGAISVRPDSVIIYGNADLIRSVDSVYTDVIKVHDADAPVQGFVSLKPQTGLRFSEEEIYYTLDVARYFESSVNVRVNVINVPVESKILLIPKDVTVFYRAVFENKRSVNPSDFQLVVDYRDMKNTSMVEPRIVRMPKDVFSVRVEPKFVESIIN